MLTGKKSLMGRACRWRGVGEGTKREGVPIGIFIILDKFGPY